jgi:hypothetical protein
MPVFSFRQGKEQLHLVLACQRDSSSTEVSRNVSVSVLLLTDESVSYFVTSCGAEQCGVLLCPSFDVEKYRVSCLDISYGTER